MARTVSSIGSSPKAGCDVLQERRYERVDGTSTLTADVRLIAATNRDLPEAIEGGVSATTSVLRLADRFLREFGERMGKRDVGLSREARDLLLAYRWPGNIRELQNATERAVIATGG